ncbi:MAG TPA: hypothetical protein VLI41_11305 [Phenylobacterium sp.]|uniref:hypothetical protein n=1 Tax=Phenylobacterium sp. TaxID=1871053 RepID=UPI002C314ECE|nr:hypothetical protein [Phenylobacterium sp.]HSV03779.1 hypothetical protein [Phenylobacterium sp.]
MRSAFISLILAAGLAAPALAQAPAATAPSAPPPAPPTTAPPSQTPPAAPVAAPATPPPPVAEAAPTLPTTGDEATILRVLDNICVPLVRGGNLDQLAQAQGMRKNRRDGTWSMPLGSGRDYTIAVQPQGVNKDVCQAEVHFAIGQDAPIFKAINVWAFLHKPELQPTANYVAVDADGIKRVRRSWENQASNGSTAVNFTTWRKPNDAPLNRNYDTGMLFYQERHF